MNLFIMWPVPCIWGNTIDYVTCPPMQNLLLNFGLNCATCALSFAIFPFIESSVAMELVISGQDHHGLSQATNSTNIIPYPIDFNSLIL